jgi:glucose/arabinose dehydrogenase
MPFGATTAFDHYQLQVSSDNTFSATFIDQDLTPSEFTDYTVPGPLVPNTKYFWRTRAWDNAGNSSSWSVVLSLRAALLPPVLDAPLNAALLDQLRPTLDWQDVPGAGSYSLQVSPYANLGSPLIYVTLGTSAYTPAANLPAARLLYWRVRANGLNGPSLWSEVRSFTTGNPPSIPGLVSPANTALVPGPSPLFDWSNSTVPPGVAFGHYQLQIANDSGFTSIVHDNDLPGITNSQDNSAVLTTGLTYFWRVRAFSDALHYSAWSSVRSVKINIAAPALSLQTFAAGFASPVHITNAGDGSGRIFVVEKCGTIRIIAGGTTLATPFLNMAGRVSCGGERGLLSVAFPPDYASKQYFYIFYTDPDGALTVSRFSVPPATPDQADADSEEVLLSIPHPNGNHNGGQLAFGNDGYLYISTGDGGGGGDPNNNGQNANVLLGKILRIDVESGAPTYAVPPTNPFYGVSGKKAEIWALGLRNPWRISFDRLTHDLYIADVGQNAWEEVDFQPAASPGGVNYGWRLREGNHCYNPPSGCGTPPNYAPPVTEYSHDLGCSITGGFVYRGAAYPILQGFYLYGDFCSGRIWVLKWWNGNWYSQMAIDTPRAPSTFGEDEQGNLYLGDIYNGTIYVIEASN